MSMGLYLYGCESPILKEILGKPDLQAEGRKNEAA